MSDDLADALGAVTLNDDTSPKTPARAPLDPDPTTPTKKSSGKRSNPNKTPRTLPPPFITHPSPNEHAATVFMLHGFTSTGKSYGNGWLPSLKKKLGSKALGRSKPHKRPWHHQHPATPFSATSGKDWSSLVEIDIPSSTSRR